MSKNGTKTELGALEWFYALFSVLLIFSISFSILNFTVAKKQAWLLSMIRIYKSEPKQAEKFVVQFVAPSGLSKYVEKINQRIFADTTLERGQLLSLFNLTYLTNYNDPAELALASNTISELAESSKAVRSHLSLEKEIEAGFVEIQAAKKQSLIVAQKVQQLESNYKQLQAEYNLLATDLYELLALTEDPNNKIKPDQEDLFYAEGILDGLPKLALLGSQKLDLSGLNTKLAELGSKVDLASDDQGPELNSKLESLRSASKELAQEIQQKTTAVKQSKTELMQSNLALKELHTDLANKLDQLFIKVCETNQPVLINSLEKIASSFS